jgi:hypothetical protein
VESNRDARVGVVVLGMAPYRDGVGETSRDLGAWAADVVDVGGVDEVSMSMTVVSSLVENGAFDSYQYISERQRFADSVRADTFIADFFYGGDESDYNLPPYSPGLLGE